MISKEDKERIVKANAANILKKLKDGKSLTKAELETLMEAPESATAPDAKASKKWSVNALAEVTGRDRRTITKVLKKAKLYPPEKFPSEQVVAALEPKEGAKEGASIKEKKTFEEWRKLKLANDEREGLLISKASVIGSIQRLNPKIGALIEQKIVNEYPAAVAGLDVPAAREFGKRFADELRREWAAFREEWQG